MSILFPPHLPRLLAGFFIQTFSLFHYSVCSHLVLCWPWRGSGGSCCQNKWLQPDTDPFYTDWLLYKVLRFAPILFCYLVALPKMLHLFNIAENKLQCIVVIQTASRLWLTGVAAWLHDWSRLVISRFLSTDHTDSASCSLQGFIVYYLSTDISTCRWSLCLLLFPPLGWEEPSANHECVAATGTSLLRECSLWWVW